MAAGEPAVAIARDVRERVDLGRGDGLDNESRRDRREIAAAALLPRRDERPRPRRRRAPRAPSRTRAADRCTRRSAGPARGRVRRSARSTAAQRTRRARHVSADRSPTRPQTPHRRGSRRSRSALDRRLVADVCREVPASCRICAELRLNERRRREHLAQERAARPSRSAGSLIGKKRPRGPGAGRRGTSSARAPRARGRGARAGSTACRRPSFSTKSQVSSTGRASASTSISDVFVLKTGIRSWSKSGRKPHRLEQLQPTVDPRRRAARVTPLRDTSTVTGVPASTCTPTTPDRRARRDCRRSRRRPSGRRGTTSSASVPESRIASSRSPWPGP